MNDHLVVERGGQETELSLHRTNYHRGNSDLTKPSQSTLGPAFTEPSGFSTTITVVPRVITEGTRFAKPSQSTLGPVFTESSGFSTTITVVPRVVTEGTRLDRPSQSTPAPAFTEPTGFLNRQRDATETYSMSMQRFRPNVYAQITGQA
jgi:hypothetical protein